MRTVEVTRYFLEITGLGELSGKHAASAGVRVVRVDPPVPALNRFFYTAIGGEYFWLDRRQWSLAEWSRQLDTPGLETWVLTDDGVPAGYFELEQMPDAVVEIKYFGLLAGFTGRGLGAHMLTEAVERAFAIGASRVILDTCSLDHPGALAHYQARGFRVYNVEMKPRALPDDPPGPWEGSDDAAVPADSKRRFRN
jgi:GNAT superfamily N-acetyltransferase